MCENRVWNEFSLVDLIYAHAIEVDLNPSTCQTLKVTWG